MAGYLATHMWRRRVRLTAADPFMSFLEETKKIYRPEEWNVPKATTE
jgi:hypothetical protein